jgi:hypothetical protein
VSAYVYREYTRRRRVVLWTVSALTAAAHLYRTVGFHNVLEKPSHAWGAET